MSFTKQTTLASNTPIYRPYLTEKTLEKNNEEERYIVDFAKNKTEILACQKLRYQVFYQEFNIQTHNHLDMVDQDYFDEYCQHLYVFDRISQRIVACTRLLDESAARDTNGFYSQQEFNLSRILSVKSKKLEIGRTCVDPAFRNGIVLGKLWRGIGQYIQHNQIELLLGCASISVFLEKENVMPLAMQMTQTLYDKYAVSDDLYVTPKLYGDIWVNECFSDHLDNTLHNKKIPLKIPSLIKSYWNLGAKVCGRPFYDADFNCLDIFILIDVKKIPKRYYHYFFK